MKKSLPLIFSLTLICLISGSILAFVHAATADRIATNALRRTTDAIRQVLPEHDTLRDPRHIEYQGTTFTLYEALHDGEVAGVAIETSTSAGYGGDIRLMIGLDPQGNTSGLVILAHKETPGLGAKITESSFLARFVGRNARQTHWNVQKDGGEIQAITAATVSSRAVSDAVARAIQAYLQHRTQGA